MSEVRRTADSATTRVGGQAWPEQRAWPEQGRMGWLETECPEVHVQQPRRPAGDADAGFPRPGRSQSVHSSKEASNDRGAKGHRKLVGAMTVKGHTAIQHSAQKAVRAGAAKAAGNRVALRGAAETRMPRQRHGPDGAVKRLPCLGQPISFGPATGKPDARNGPVRFGGRGEVQTLVPTPIAGESATKNWTFGNQASSSLKNCGCRPASHQTSGRSRRTTPGCWSGSGSSRRVEASKMWRPMSRATIAGRRNDARVACQRASNAHSLPRLPPTSQPSQSLKSTLNLARSARARPARY
jgi:hypothetical protein